MDGLGDFPVSSRVFWKEISQLNRVVVFLT